LVTIASGGSTLEVGAIVTGLIGGLALFLFGLDQMTDALRIVAGNRMKALLGRLTTNRFKAAFAGAFVTSVIQSSSVTTVLLVGFISAGLLSLSQSVGVIMGANSGTSRSRSRSTRSSSSRSASPSSSARRASSFAITGA
jgi:phosphate:Na+ symporter